jgi:hypothetical protein
MDVIVQYVKKIRLPFWLFCCIFFPLYFIIENHNHRFDLCDFKVYYLAAQNLLAHQPIYHQVFGQASGFYKYSPVVLLFFIPFAFLPYMVAASVYFAIVSLFMFLTIKKIATFAQALSGKPASGAVQYLLLLIGGTQFFRELHVGNINTMLLFLCMIALELLWKNKKITSGMIFGLVILFKPHFVVLLPLLLFFRLPVSFLAAIGTAVAGVVVPMAAFGFGGDLAVHREWLSAMAQHNGSEELIKAPNTLHHLVSIFIHGGFTGMNTLITAFGLALIYGIILFLAGRDKTRVNNSHFIALAFLVCIAAIPNITFTDTEHFLLLLPLVGYLVNVFSGENTWAKLLMICAFVMYGGNWFDVWGRTLSDTIERVGILGIGNALIIGLALFVWTRRSHLISSE